MNEVFLLNKIRTSLSPEARRSMKRFVDRFFSPIGSINGARTTTDRVGLTFDDGPDPAVTPRVLDLLAARGRKATFFVLTEKAERHPEIVQRMIAEGHEVALHFDRHDRITELPVEDVRKRLIEARAKLEALAGPIRFFRPPFGSQSLATFFLAKSLGLEIVTWGPYGEDWVEQQPEDVAVKAMRNMRGGEILLLHDAVELPDGEFPPTFDRVRMVELVLDALEDAALVPGTVGALVNADGARLSVWFR